ncbi:hypothetical protein HaLaN_21494 [Haematococcus lacustris]|uniref:Uncharacterized protein n=1 Tax=Haematococcus lacustris TaxID=44745 RepID=A0A6A0A2S7_HAELA|nr:hypothetical protein HaLaN_21494 [Haematococcus lacustris]
MPAKAPHEAGGRWELNVQQAFSTEAARSYGSLGARTAASASPPYLELSQPLPLPAAGISQQALSKWQHSNVVNEEQIGYTGDGGAAAKRAGGHVPPSAEYDAGGAAGLSGLTCWTCCAHACCLSWWHAWSR